MVQKFLQKFGLSENEIRVYLHLVTHGETIASIIAKRLDLKRSTVYQALDALEKRQLLLRFVKNDVTHFDVVDPDAIIDLCEKRLQDMRHMKQEAEMLQREFEKMRNGSHQSNLEINGKIQYYEGLEHVTDLIDETLQEDHKEQLCFGLNDYHTRLAGDDWQLYTQKRIEKGMRVRSVQPNTKEATEYKNRDKQELRNTRLVPKDIFPSDCEINIIGDLIAMFTVKGQTPMGMKMRSDIMAEALRSLFELAWERAGDYNKELEKEVTEESERVVM